MPGCFDLFGLLILFVDCFVLAFYFVVSFGCFVVLLDRDFLTGYCFCLIGCVHLLLHVWIGLLCVGFVGDNLVVL